MKNKKLLPIIAAVVVLLAAGAFFVIKSQTKTTQNLTLVKDTGSISYKTDKDYVNLDSDKKEIPNHSYIKTGDDGLAHVILPDKSMISLDKKTEMQVNYDAGSTNILQTLGQAWYRIQKLTGKEEFTVETTTAVATVRGTIFAVQKAAALDTVYVTENSVEIAQLKDKAKQNIQTLAENKLSNIGSIDSGTPKIIKIPDSIKQSAWFKRNQILDQQFKKGLPDDFVKKLHENPDVQQIDMRLRAPTDSTNPLSQFSDYSWLQNGQTACSYINSTEYTNLIAEIKSESAMFGSWGKWLLDGINMAQNACKDGVVDPAEMTRLQNYYQNSPQPSFDIPSQ